MLVVDDAIALAQEALGQLGELRLVPGRAIGPTLPELAEAEVLLVRSVTRIDDRLLDAAPRLRLVGTATAGIDHVDEAALAKRGIAFAHAPGCNAQAVAEWVVAALIDLASRPPSELDELLMGPIGLVGCGEVGSRLARLVRRLGWTVLCCDPARAQRGDADEAWVSIDELWAACPVISLHVPLVHDGEHTTKGLIDFDRPRLAATGSKLLINTSRGAVVKDRALDRADLHTIVLDVFEREPALHWARLADPRLARVSPHVAGYSLEGKLRATAAMHAAVARLRGVEPSWTGTEQLPDQRLSTVSDEGRSDPWSALQALIEQVIALSRDDARVRALVELPEHERPAAFEQLRRGYVFRRELAGCSVVRDRSLDAEVQLGGLRAPIHAILERLGVRVLG